MATYQLNAADLLTLLASTVTPGTESSIINALTNAGIMPGSAHTLITEVLPGPPGATGAYDDTIASGVQFELITLPTSTLSGSNFPTPTVGASLPSATFNLFSSGNVVVASGDQSVTINDKNKGSVADTLVGGAGFEHFNYSGPSTKIQGGSGNQTLTGGNSSTSTDTLIGGSGNDVLQVFQGNNRVVGGSGNDTLLGGAGGDTLVGGGASSLVAGAGNQRLVGGQISGAHETLVGGPGDDTLIVKTGNNSLVAGSGLNTLKAGAGNDTLVGGGHSRLVASTGNTSMHSSPTGPGDTLVAGSGDDTLVASGGSNRLVLGTGNDTVILGTGDDTVVASSAAGHATVYGGFGPGRIVDNIGEAVTLYGGIGGEKVFLGTTGDDSIISGVGAMSIHSLQNSTDLVSNSSTAVGGLHTLTFKDGQTIIVNDANQNITIQFADKGPTTPL